MFKKFFLISFIILPFQAFSLDLGVNFPQHNSKDHSQNLLHYQKRYGLLGNPSYLSRLAHVGEKELEKLKDYLSKKQRFAIREFLIRVRHLSTIKPTDENLGQRLELVNQMVELIQAYQETSYVLEKKYPLKSVYKHPFFHGVIHPYFKRIALSDEQKYTKRLFAINVVGEDGEFLTAESLANTMDRSKLNPKKSSFWAPSSSKEDIYNYHTLKKYKSLCTDYPLYRFRGRKKAPEEGGGLNPGVKVFFRNSKNKKVKAKVKFAMARKRNSFVPLFQKQEAYLEPTGNALMKRLGYNVDTGIYCNKVRFKYQSEFFDLTKSNQINAQLWDLQHYYSDFVLKNGDIVPLKDAMNRITYFDHSKRTPKDPWAKIVTKYSIKKQYVGEIAEIILNGAYIEYREKKTKRYTSWKKEILAHQDRREVRALGLFDSWLGSTDNFANNLKLSIEKTKGKIKNIKFILSDMGDIFSTHYRLVDEDMGNFPPELKILLDNNGWEEFGKAVIPYKKQSELELQLNDFTFSIFTKSVGDKTPNWHWYEEDGKIKKIMTDLQFMNFGSIRGINKFILFEDYKWAARQIAKISEKEILHALCLSGLGYPGAVLMTEKLISRRDELVVYFGLTQEFKLLRPNGPNKYMSLRDSGTIKVKGANGVETSVTIPTYSNFVDDGEFYSKL